MSVLFDIVFSIFALISIPKFLVRLNQSDRPRELMRERFGFLPPDIQERCRLKKPLWLHAVSVGEVMAARSWINRFLGAYPEASLVLSVTTPTGYSVAQKLVQERLSVVYAPFDLSFVVRRVFSQARPFMIVLMETEIWPNLIREARAQKIPIGIINGRISPRAFRRYCLVKFLMKPLLMCLSFCLVQSERDAEHFRQLGMSAEKTVVTGNMKFDSAKVTAEAVSSSHPALKRLRGSERLVLVGGSTHWDEEEILLRVFKRLRPNYPHLKMILAPRHPERLEKVRKAIEEAGLAFQLFSVGDGGRDFDVLLVDQMGVLAAIYSVSDVVFMGGSLICHGGQNPIEPAFLKKALVHGPHTFNFHEVYEKLDREGAAVQVKGEDQLCLQLGTILGNGGVRQEMGVKAHQVVESLQGATERNMNYLSGWLENPGHHRQPEIASRIGVDP